MNALTTDTSAELQRIRSLQISDIERHDWSGNVVFSGTKGALKSSGLIPEGTMFPDECDAKRGVRWRSKTGRRFVLSRGWGPDGTYRLTVYPTPAEKRQLEHAQKVKLDSARLDKEIAYLDVGEETYRNEMARLVLMGWHVGKQCLTDSRAWAYSPDVIDAVQDHMDKIRSLLSHGRIEHRPETLAPLKARRAALSDARLQNLLAGLEPAQKSGA